MVPSSPKYVPSNKNDNFDSIIKIFVSNQVGFIQVLVVTSFNLVRVVPSKLKILGSSQKNDFDTEFQLDTAF